MHSAPTVNYPVGRSRFAGALLLIAWLLGAAACTQWWFETQSTSWRYGLAWLVLVACGFLAEWTWRHSPSGELTWDAAAWHWSAVPHEHNAILEVALDLQFCLLLRCKAGGVIHWLWLERASSAQRWNDLRRAVYSRARPDALRQDGPPAAKP